MNWRNATKFAYIIWIVLCPSVPSLVIDGRRVSDETVHHHILFGFS